MSIYIIVIIIIIIIIIIIFTCEKVKRVFRRCRKFGSSSETSECYRDGVLNELVE